MCKSSETYSNENVFSKFALIRNFLQLLAIANTDDLPKQSVVELADILIGNLDFLTVAYKELTKKIEEGHNE